jgi:hypothetical protein
VNFRNALKRRRVLDPTTKARMLKLRNVQRR